MHKNVQLNIPNINAFSVGLNLPHILKIHSALYEHTQPNKTKKANSVCPCGTPSYSLHFASVTFWGNLTPLHGTLVANILSAHQETPK